VALTPVDKLSWCDLTVAGARRSLVWLRSRNPYPSALQHDRLAEIGRLRRPSNISGAEAPNVTINVDNADGALTALLTGAQHAPLSVLAYGESAALSLFTGAIESIEGGSTVRLTAVGADLAARFPLRPASVLGAFAGDGYLPLVFGQAVTLTPVRFRPDGRQWLICDGAATRIRSVIVDGDPIGAGDFELAPEIVDGLPVTTVFIPRPPEDSISVTVDGLADPDTGVLLENPALIARYVLGLMNYPLSRAEVDAFRLATLDLRLRGVIDGTETSRREVLQQILESAQCIWSLGMPGLGRRWPPAAAAGPLAGTLTPLISIEPTYRQLPIVNRLEVRYDYDWSEQAYRRALIVEAPASIDRYGRREADQSLDLPWIGEPAAAEALALARLGYDAGPTFEVTFSADGLVFQPGDVWSIAHPLSPLSGRQLAIEAGIDVTRNNAEITVAGSAEAPATAVVVQRSNRLVEDDQQLTVTRDADDLIIVATDLAGDPLPGSTVLLAGQSVTANQQGEARFRDIQPGTYEIVITATGRDRIVSTVTVPA
jgi:hypothetical protein